MTMDQKAERAIRLIERAANEPEKFAARLRECSYITDPQRFERAMQILEHLTEFFEEGPDAEWWYDYHELSGEHWICSDEGWEPGDVVASYLEEDPNWKPICEVNTPA